MSIDKDAGEKNFAREADGGRPGQPGGKQDQPGAGQKKFRRKKASLTDISAVLDKVLGSYGLERRMKEQAFMSVWFDVVDEPFKQTSRPLFIDNEGNLVVSVKDASVAQELSFSRFSLLKRLAPFARSVGVRLSAIRFDLKHFREEQMDEAFSVALMLHKTMQNRSLPDEKELQEIELDEESALLLAEQKEELKKISETEGRIYDRLSRLYERELRVRLWREKQDYPRCTACGYPEPQLLGERRLCRNCHVMNTVSYHQSEH